MDLARLDFNVRGDGQIDLDGIDVFETPNLENRGMKPFAVMEAW